MTTVKRFEDLDSWQEARKFVAYIYDLTKNDQFIKDFGLVRQVRESAVSSMANIAEGFHRNSNREFMRFLDYSRASIAETISHLYVALDQKYIDKQEIDNAKRIADIVWRKVNSFISYLKRDFEDTKPPRRKNNSTDLTSTTN
jgi:four helix bundle protein